ncbi:solute carrier organic anion transporter family member 1C1 isoform X1 [Monodelphis domestica]|uniref:Solute carrier organic anion transporter family member n=1 Tax=Monodelphis domestica TaxID=13616 RepID=A0A5F8H981_MONDO|nr:solute carrier organic anion transporter family member 1C1 isoform X1 [Monodelphis domestica]
MENSAKENTQLFFTKSERPMNRTPFKSQPSISEGKQPCCGELKVFLCALSFVYFAKALSEGYLKSTITQIERRFEIPTSLVGVIDGSFEIGNLLVITFVSYFGAKLHRPKIIGTGCLIMGVGTLLIAIPHFFMGHYRYEKFSPSNSTTAISPCLQEHNKKIAFSVLEKSQSKVNTGCESETQTSMWVYVFLGNLLRGIGETPIQPLGITYIDDHASEDNAAFYIGCVQTVAIIGPIFGFLLGSMCAKLYVDIGFVNLDNLAITPKDTQWVGAWWLGYLIAGTLSLIAAVPFWFLPKSLLTQRDTNLMRLESRKDSISSSEKSKFIVENSKEYHIHYQERVTMLEMARDFLPSLKRLFGNPVYFLYLCASTVQFNSLFGMVTYKPKYIEQQYGQSSSKTNFVIGLINIPAVAFGMFSGGLVMKKFRITLFGASKLYLGSLFFGYLLLLSLFAIGCDNSDVAGLSISYQGTRQVSYYEQALLSDCNSGCTCSQTEWDPICGENGITYVSACLAGCQSSTGSGKNTIFYNCTCIGITESKSGNSSGIVGRCQKGNDCSKMFLYFLVISVITSYTLSVGGIPGYILLLRSISPHFKSFALGIYTLAIRVFAGIPAPIYFGVLIDTTCLKWGVKKCGYQGACRLYDSYTFRYIYLGLTMLLGTMSTFLSIAMLFVLKRRSVSENGNLENSKDEAMESTSSKKEHLTHNDHIFETFYWPGKETEL